MQPACLPKFNASANVSGWAGKPALVSGFGVLRQLLFHGVDILASVMQYVFLPVLTMEQCRDQHENAWNPKTRYNISDDMFCAGYMSKKFLKQERDSCGGDSGGPLVVFEKEEEREEEEEEKQGVLHFG